MGGMAFLSPDAVLPKMVDTLGGRVAIVAMMPVLLGAAFSMSQLFSAPLVERLPKLKPWVLTFGFLQRLPYLITGLLLLSGNNLGGNMLTLVVLTPVISGLIGGLGVVAWMEMVTRMIPEKQRASGWAIRYVIQAVLGIAAGPVIHWILTHQEGTDGYAILHLIAFGFLALSYTAQIPMREHLLTPETEIVSKPYFSYLASLPGLFLSTPHLGKLVLVRFTGMGYLMILGFLTKHALEVTHRPEADEGFFVTFSQVGTILGSLLAGWWGNRSGGTVLLLTVAADVLAQSGDLGALPASVLTDPTQAIGKTVRNGIAAGQPLRSDLLTAAWAVQQGQSVKLLSTGAGFTISNEGN